MPQPRRRQPKPPLQKALPPQNSPRHRTAGCPWKKSNPGCTPACRRRPPYYLDSTGLPVLTGETKISIEGWGDEDYSDYDADSTIQVALDEALLNTDSATASFPRMDGEDYAIVPISIQVLYPANGGSADITLPDNVELLEYSFTSGDLCAATEEERQRQLHYDFSEVTASVTGIYVKATENFSVTLTYTDSEKSLTKALHVTLDDSAPFPGILQDRFAQEAQPATCSADAGVAAYAGLQVTQCVYTSVGWMNYLGGQPALCADSGKWAWGPGATYANKYPPVANYSSAGSVWVLAEFFGKGWTADQATMWAQASTAAHRPRFLLARPRMPPTTTPILTALRGRQSSFRTALPVRL